MKNRRNSAVFYALYRLNHQTKDDMKVFCLLFFKKVGVFKSYFTSFYKEIKDYETRHKSFGSAFSKAEKVFAQPFSNFFFNPLFAYLSNLI